MNRTRSVGIALVTALAVALPTRLPAQNGTVYGPILKPGDAVRIAVWRKPELSGEFPVGADSAIADPFYQSVKVAGLPLSVAAERVRAHVARYEMNPSVLVEPLLRVAVRGDVRQPNLYTLRSEMTVLQAVMLAGGPTERGKLSDVRVVREGQIMRVDLTDANSPGAQMPIRSGDQIVVERRSSVFRDYIAPAASITGAAAAIINIILQNR